MLSTILIVLLILRLVGALPPRLYSASWGYAPGGICYSATLIAV
ncbi:MAG: DUF3309 family protein [Candidatus Acidiferrales bacterium]